MGYGEAVDVRGWCWPRDLVGQLMRGGSRPTGFGGWLGVSRHTGLTSARPLDAELLQATA
jgi:hypothetical protein